YCFIEGSYFVDPTKKLPLHFELPNSVKVDFYQWTPFIFLLIALLFHTPRIFWAAVNSTSYMYFQELCESSIEYRDPPHKECVRRFDVVSTSYPPQMPSHFGIGNLNKYYEEKISDKYLIILYFVVKVWHIVNVIIATLLLCLLTPSHLDDYFGIHTIWNLVTGVNWKKSGAFPRITTCEIGIRQSNWGRHDRIKNEQSQCFLA
uniref:Innexin n=1 Tax=Panagrolaimus sp. PS1159 TaxID=55785 RepID=A0AC35GRG7_9BILA